MQDKYFYLKNYKIIHNEKTVKITTDSVLIGALVNGMNRYERILDVGCGCGIISFILADRFKYSVIESVDVDSYSCEITERNIKENDLCGRMSVYNCSIEEFVSSCKCKYYDLVVCNPPYYDSSFLSGDERRNEARQDSVLSLNSLLQSVATIISDVGFFYFIYPYSRFSDVYNRLSYYGYHMREVYKISPYNDTACNRVVFSLSKRYGRVKVEDIYIRCRENGSYSAKYFNIVKEILKI